jgi:hypothetical protein
LKLAEGFFLVPVTSALSGYNISPLRLIPPKAVPFQDKFVVFSGIIDQAPPMCKILRQSKNFNSETYYIYFMFKYNLIRLKNQFL